MEDLVVLQSIDDKPVPMQKDQSLDFGEYDVRNGATFEFFIKNPNEKLIADISNFYVWEDHATFHGPSTIKPQETVKVSIKIQPLKLDDLKNMELPDDNFHVKGKTKWSNYHTRFEQ